MPSIAVAALKVIPDEIPEESLNTFQWFYDNFLKSYTEKCYLLTTSRPPANNSSATFLRI